MLKTLDGRSFIMAGPILWCCFVGNALGQADKITANNLLDALRPSLIQLTDTFGRISSIEYESSRAIKLGDIGGPSGEEYRDGRLYWRSSGSHYYYEVTPVQRKSENKTLTVAFDGHYAQVFEPKERVLSLAKQDFKSLPGPLANDIFAAFSFFPSDHQDTNAFTNPFWKFVSKIERWEAVLKSAKYVGKADVQGAQCNVIEVPAPNWVGTTTFKVYLSSMPQGYPIKWELLNEKKQTLIRFTVQRFGEVRLDGGSIFFYPQIATKENFGLGSKESPISEVPISTITFNIVNLKVNQKLKEGAFTVDPGAASAIFDVDAGKLITVPR